MWRWPDPVGIAFSFRGRAWIGADRGRRGDRPSAAAVHSPTEPTTVAARELTLSSSLRRWRELRRPGGDARVVAVVLQAFQLWWAERHGTCAVRDAGGEARKNRGMMARRRRAIQQISSPPRRIRLCAPNQTGGGASSMPETSGTVESEDWASPMAWHRARRPAAR